MGHCCIAQYVMLAEKGFISYEALDTFCRRDSILGASSSTAARSWQCSTKPATGSITSMTCWRMAPQRT